MGKSGEWTVKVRGYREAVHALQRFDRDSKKAILDGLKEAAGPVTDDANRRLDRYQGIGRVTTRASVAGVFIRQSHRKVTGRRGDFGALQMRKGLIPAVNEGEERFVLGIEHELDRLIVREGFR